MSEEQLLKLKNEIRNEILKELENKKNYGTWYKYSKEFIELKLKEIFGDDRRTAYRIKCGLNAIAVSLVRKEATKNIDDTDLIKIKPTIEFIIKELEINSQLKEQQE